MIQSPHPLLESLRRRKVWRAIIVVGVLLLAVWTAQHASRRYLFLIVAGLSSLLFLRHPELGLLVLIAAALVVPIEIGTGTEVKLNPATLLAPAVFALWLLKSLLQWRLHWVPSRVNKPLFLFLLAGLLSLLAGNALWDPAVPHSNHFWLVQSAQWAIFAFSAAAFWSAGNLLPDERWLQRLVFFFLVVAGVLALLIVWLGLGRIVGSVATLAPSRTPFWVLLVGLVGGQLLFNNHDLTRPWRAFLLAVLGAVVLYAFAQQREAASNWVGVAAAACTLMWLRWPRLRWLGIVLLVALTLSGVLFPTLYEFAGGDAEWTLSGGSRLALITRVIQVTLRNPITGLGPAAYRPYAAVEPLVYGHTVWFTPRVNSHNNYVDVFAHTGLLGLGLFLWFLVELGQLGWRLSGRLKQGFLGGFVNGMLAVWAGSLVIMMLVDWILPFVYNVGFPGFQASVLVWFFWGGLLAVENWYARDK